MPDVQDAIRVVTDPANLAGASDHHSDVREVNEQRAVTALREQGAGRAEARTLAAEAVRELGGRVDSRVRSGGMAAGRDTRRVIETWYVPIEAVRS